MARLLMFGGGLYAMWWIADGGTRQFDTSGQLIVIAGGVLFYWLMFRATRSGSGR